MCSQEVDERYGHFKFNILFKNKYINLLSPKYSVIQLIQKVQFKFTFSKILHELMNDIAEAAPNSAYKCT